jgi:futalosine hydrolase
MNILLAAATEREIAPTLAWLHAHAVEADKDSFSLGAVSVQMCLTGVGIMAATEALTRALLTTRYAFALQAGVAGTFDHGIPLGEVVRVESETLADLGAEDHDGSLLDVYRLGLAGHSDAPFRNGRLESNWQESLLSGAFSGLRSVSGITVQTVSGAASTITSRAERYGVGVETMEGAPFHFCCLKAEVPFVQLRAISNYVEPRNRAAWKMPEAIAALNTTLISAMELWSRAPHGIS